MGRLDGHYVYRLIYRVLFRSRIDNCYFLLLEQYCRLWHHYYPLLHEPFGFLLLLRFAYNSNYSPFWVVHQCPHTDCCCFVVAVKSQRWLQWKFLEGLLLYLIIYCFIFGKLFRPRIPYVLTYPIHPQCSELPSMKLHYPNGHVFETLLNFFIK